MVRQFKKQYLKVGHIYITWVASYIFYGGIQAQN